MDDDARDDCQSGRVESLSLDWKVPVRFLGVALVSLAMLVLELTLTRLSSATMSYGRNS